MTTSPARTRSGPSCGPLLDDTDREAGQIELVGRHDAGVLGRLPADQRAAGLAAALVHPRHHGRHLVGVDLARGDVVEHEQRLGAHADQVVDAHGDQVDADRVVAAGVPGDHHLGAHPVGRSHQDRLRGTDRCRAGTGRRTRRCPAPWSAGARRRRRRPRCPRRRRRRWRRPLPRRSDPGERALVGGAGGGRRHRLRSPQGDGRRDGRRIVAGEAGVAEPAVGADGRLQVLDADVGQRVRAENCAPSPRRCDRSPAAPRATGCRSRRSRASATAATRCAGGPRPRRPRAACG